MWPSERDAGPRPEGGSRSRGRTHVAMRLFFQFLLAPMPARSSASTGVMRWACPSCEMQALRPPLQAHLEGWSWGG